MNENNQEFQLWNIEKKALLLMLDSLMEMKSQYEEGIKESVDLQKEVDDLKTVRRSSQKYIEKLEADNRDLRKRIHSLHSEMYGKLPVLTEKECEDSQKVSSAPDFRIDTPFGEFMQFDRVFVEIDLLKAVKTKGHFFQVVHLNGLLVSCENDLLELDLSNGYKGMNTGGFDALVERFADLGYKDETPDGVSYFIPTDWIVSVKRED